LILSVNIILIVIIIWVSYLKAESSPIRVHFFIALILKLSSGVILGMVYFHYYKSGDTLAFDEAAIDIVKLYGNSFRDFMGFLINDISEDLTAVNPTLNEPRSAFFIKIISVLYILTSCNYWLSSIYLSLLSFSGSWLLANTLIKQNIKMQVPALLAFLYFPTFVFWTSGILKETVSWFCIGILISYLLLYLQNKYISLKRILVSVLIVYILWHIKYYYAAVLFLCFGPVVLYYLIQYQLKQNVKYYIVLCVSLIFIGLLLAISHPNLYPDRLFQVIIENHNKIQQLSATDHSIRFIHMDNPYIHFIINIPISLYGGLFMPLPWQGVNFLASATGIVNILLLIFSAGKIYGLLRARSLSISIPEISMAIYIIILAILLAYSAPNFGTLERYKTSYIAFFAFWVLYDNPFFQRICRFIIH